MRPKSIEEIQHVSSGSLIRLSSHNKLYTVHYNEPIVFLFCCDVREIDIVIYYIRNGNVYDRRLTFDLDTFEVLSRIEDAVCI